MYSYAILAHDPLVRVVRNLASAAECEAVIALGKPNLSPAKVSGENGGYVSDARTASSTWVQYADSELATMLGERVADHLDCSLACAEAMQILNYQVGGGYRAHFDSYDTTDPQRTPHKRGQRLFTAVLYLNDVAGGGETAFPELSLAVAPRQGRLLSFANCFPGTVTVHPKSLHESRPVTAGEKWAASFWFRER